MEVTKEQLIEFACNQQDRGTGVVPAHGFSDDIDIEEHCYGCRTWIRGAGFEAACEPCPLLHSRPIEDNDEATWCSVLCYKTYNSLMNPKQYEECSMEEIHLMISQWLCEEAGIV